MMSTADMAMRMDPIYEPISRRFHENPAEFADAFARAWFKLTHRDMGPIARYLGPEVPSEELIWQDPVPAVDHELIDEADIATLKAKVLDVRAHRLRTGLDCLGVGIDVPQQRQAWRRQRCAPSPRSAERLGGEQPTRTAPDPGRRWKASARSSTAREHRCRWPTSSCSADVRRSRQRRKSAGHDITVPFTPGRTDATQEQTDVESFAALEPLADGFRNYLGKGNVQTAEALLVDRSQLLTLTAPEMTVLVGGLRALNANANGSVHGVFTDRAGSLTNDFFVNLLDIEHRMAADRRIRRRVRGS